MIRDMLSTRLIECNIFSLICFFHLLNLNTLLSLLERQNHPQLARQKLITPIVPLSLESLLSLYNKWIHLLLFHCKIPSKRLNIISYFSFHYYLQTFCVIVRNIERRLIAELIDKRNQNKNKTPEVCFPFRRCKMVKTVA